MAIPATFKYPLLVVTFILAGYSMSAQQIDTLNSGAEPRGGVARLAVEFIKINFTLPQRAVLDHTQLELIFLIDSTGMATLEDVNGVTDQSIIDSLRRTTNHLAPFRPGRTEGHATEGVYSMVLQYPTYIRPRSRYGEPASSYRKLTRDDLADFELGSRMDVLIGGLVNGFTGTAHTYLSTGGGMKIDVNFAGKKGYGGGFMMTVYGNHRKKDYEIDPSRYQQRESTTVMVGFIVNKLFKRTDRTSWLVQFEPSYAAQNISIKENNNDKNNVQFQGFSPGLTLHYIMRMGREHFTSSYGVPGLSAHYINLHTGIRPLFYNDKAGSGILLEAGISYRLAYHFFESYTLKE